MKHLSRMLLSVFRYVPGYSIFGVLVTVMNAVERLIFTAFMPKFLYDALVSGMPWGKIVSVVLLYGGYMVICFLANDLMDECFRPSAEARLFQSMQKPIFAQALRLDMRQFDDSTFYDDYRWATSEADKRAMSAYRSFLELLSCLTLLSGYLGVMLTLDPFVAVLAGLFYVASFLINKRLVKLNLQKAEAMNEQNRRQEYVYRIFFSQEYAKELRLTNIQKPLLTQFTDTTYKILDIHRSYGTKLMRLQIVLALVRGILLNGGVYAYLSYALLIVGSITVGEFIGLAASAENIIWRVQNLVNLVSKFAEHSLYAKKYYAFLSAEPEMTSGDREPAPRADLAVRGLSFSYPGTGRPVLKNINLSIRYGEKVAVVGRNGAGKTTLVKLLLRMYDPDEGEIQYGGTRIQEYSADKYRRQFGVLFQDFHIFAATLAQNVAMDISYDGRRLLAALSEAGLELSPSVFPDGVDTLISKQFGDAGTLLSGGQMQKVAIARALYASPEILIFDEPSSALDPIAEYTFNHTLVRQMTGKTLVIIAHRLSTVRMMDRIVLIDGQEITEEGSHDELMARGGLYAQMFTAQMKQYKTDGEVE